MVDSHSMSLLIFTVLALGQTQPVGSVPYCSLAKYTSITQSYDDFESGSNGWRQWGENGCYSEAAELLANYRRENDASLGAAPRNSLLFHEAQLRASAGENSAAEDLIDEIETRSVIAPVAIYYAATAAFLRNDKVRLEQMRKELSEMPMPKEFEDARRRYVEANGGEGPKWPMNLDVVDDLIKCFGQPYLIAYSCSYQ